MAFHNDKYISRENKKIFLSILPIIDNGIDKNESKILKEGITKDLKNTFKMDKNNYHLKSKQD